MADPQHLVIVRISKDSLIQFTGLEKAVAGIEKALTRYKQSTSPAQARLDAGLKRDAKARADVDRLNRRLAREEARQARAQVSEFERRAYRFGRSLLRPTLAHLGSETVKQIMVDLLQGATGSDILKRQLRLFVPEFLREPFEQLQKRIAEQIEQRAILALEEVERKSDLRHQSEREYWRLRIAEDAQRKFEEENRRFLEEAESR